MCKHLMVAVVFSYVYYVTTTVTVIRRVYLKKINSHSMRKIEILLCVIPSNGGAHHVCDVTIARKCIQYIIKTEALVCKHLVAVVYGYVYDVTTMVNTITRLIFAKLRLQWVNT